jgi:hypothetical protein
MRQLSELHATPVTSRPLPERSDGLSRRRSHGCSAFATAVVYYHLTLNVGCCMRAEQCSRQAGSNSVVFLGDLSSSSNSSSKRDGVILEAKLQSVAVV